MPTTSDWPAEVHAQYLACLDERDRLQERIDELEDSLELEYVQHIEKRFARAVTLAKGLFEMIPTQTWRDAGGDDGQGHYEGEYRAEQIRQEIEEMLDDVSY